MLLKVIVMTKIDDYLTIKEAAKYLGVSAMTLRRWDSDKKLKAIRYPVNKYRLYIREQLENILRRKNDR